MIAGSAFLASCGKPPDIPVIGSGSEYSDLLKKAQGLSQESLEKFERGEELTSGDKKKLEESLKIFEGLIAFNPEHYGPYFGAGKIYQILGRKEQAIISMQNFAALAPASPAPEVKLLMAEANYTAGVLHEEAGNFEQANQLAEDAVELVKDNPNYLAFLASAKLREKDPSGARKLVDSALKLRPNHGRARQLKSLLDAGDEH